MDKLSNVKVTVPMEISLDPGSSGQLLHDFMNIRTLSGPELFINMVSVLHTNIPDVKYMYDTSLIEMAKNEYG